MMIRSDRKLPENWNSLTMGVGGKSMYADYINDQTSCNQQPFRLESYDSCRALDLESMSIPFAMIAPSYR
jgi:hypothetical protein